MSKKRAVPNKPRLLLDNPLFARVYLATSLAVLFATTLLWSILGAKLQQNNADQLVNPYLFRTASTWHGAMIPDQHTFLIKWPLFYLIKLFNYSSFSYISLTVMSVLVTIGVFVFILSRIEKRPLILGTIILAICSVLLLVPAQPYAGGILPVNMAMLSTRNIEYAIYIVGLLFLIKSKHYLGRYFILSIVILSLLLASDTLFMVVTVVGSMLALFIYSLLQQRKLTWLLSKWVLVSLVSSALAIIILYLIRVTHYTNIIAGAITGPYGAAHTTKSFVLGMFYAVSGIFTNFGANPGYNALTIKALPGQIANNLFSFAGIAYVVNLGVLIICCYAALVIILKSFKTQTTNKDKGSDAYAKLSILLLWSSLSVTGLFIVSQHYYVVDSRYLTLVMFSLFIGVAVWGARHTKISKLKVSIVGAVLLTSIAFGVVSSLNTHNQQTQVLQMLSTRNDLINKTLRSHHVSYLLGDYWRVMPIKYLSNDHQQVVPLTNCSTNRQVLTSQAWQPDLTHASFAYLLTIHGSLTDFPSCNIAEVTSTYGLPNSTALISGTAGNPDELLLFYDNGIHHAKHHTITPDQISSVIKPTSLSSLTNSICQGPSIMNIVAHQDDDLLFMNPDLWHEIQNGYCVRTVYVTAGDGGNGTAYWLSRERGSEAAYSQMIGPGQHWIERVARLTDGQYVSIDSPIKNNKISLIFMHLPDGGLKGNGFSVNHFESLAKLYSGNIKSISSVDNQSNYSLGQLVDGLTALMETYLPTRIQTQANYVSGPYPDHSDHITTDKITTRARQQYETVQYANQLSIPIFFYIGYPIHQFSANVSGTDLSVKEHAFLAYAKFDPSVCQSLAQCNASSTYGLYLQRMYQNSN